MRAYSPAERHAVAKVLNGPPSERETPQPQPLPKSKAKAKKLTLDKAREIRKLHGEGVKQKEIATRYGVTPSCVNHIIKGLTYQEDS